MAIEQTHHEENQRKAGLCDEAAAAYEAELSATNDGRRRQRLGEEVRREREVAMFYREEADKLQSEA